MVLPVTRKLAPWRLSVFSIIVITMALSLFQKVKHFNLTAMLGSSGLTVIADHLAILYLWIVYSGTKTLNHIQWLAKYNRAYSIGDLMWLKDWHSPSSVIFLNTDLFAVTVPLSCQWVNGISSSKSRITMGFITWPLICTGARFSSELQCPHQMIGFQDSIPSNAPQGDTPYWAKLADASVSNSHGLSLNRNTGYHHCCHHDNTWPSQCQACLWK